MSDIGKPLQEHWVEPQELDVPEPQEQEIPETTEEEAPA